MNKSLSSIIDTTELKKIILNENLIIVDASASENSRLNYENKHIENAIFVDLNSQLADIKNDFAIGGRHPLPDIIKFSETLSELGISPDSHIIIYDEKTSSNAASRFWWMLKAIGHQKVQVLNGGLEAAEKYNIPLSSAKVEIKRTDLYPIQEWLLPISSLDEVEKISKNNDYIVIDVRDNDRYKGLREPIDLIAGHIPGAVNVPFITNLDSDGLYLSPDLLKEKYLQVIGNTKIENVIVHCGSGVTACHTLLAFDYAGLDIPKLYVGSWSEWSRNNKTIIQEL